MTHPFDKDNEVKERTLIMFNSAAEEELTPYLIADRTADSIIKECKINEAYARSLLPSVIKEAALSEARTLCRKRAQVGGRSVTKAMLNPDYYPSIDELESNLIISGKDDNTYIRLYAMKYEHMLAALDRKQRKIDEAEKSYHEFFELFQQCGHDMAKDDISFGDWCKKTGRIQKIA